MFNFFKITGLFTLSDSKLHEQDLFHFFRVCGGPIQVLWEENHCQNINDILVLCQESQYAPKVIRFFISWVKQWIKSEIFPVCSLNEDEIKCGINKRLHNSHVFFQNRGVLQNEGVFYSQSHQNMK